MELENLKKLITISEELENDESVQNIIGVFDEAFHKVIRDISDTVPDDQGTAEMNVMTKYITANVAAKGFVRAYARYLGELADEYNASKSKEEQSDGKDSE